MALNVHVIECDSDPVIAPTQIGQHWVNTTTDRMWFSVGTASISDWVEMATDTDTDVSTYICPSGVSVGDFVYVSGNDTIDKADASDSNKKYTLGLVTLKPTPTTAIVQTNGKASVLTGLTAGLPVFLSDTLSGGYTQTPITTSGNWLQILGMATDSSTISLEINQPIKRL